MFVRKFVAVTVLTLTSHTSQAQSAILPSAAHYQCASWLDARREPGSSKAHTMVAWTWGYISGVAHADRRFRGVELPSALSVSAWMDSYCEQNSRNNILLGANRLMEELASKKQL
ncbi:hypothetical protein [Acidovorax sp. LjRoot117]|uniref:hypothetical protein n=1 Tax=Acidovorax sp. LjRoot117 TaxID=3342255 RepID=UPI003ECFFCB4